MARVPKKKRGKSNGGQPVVLVIDIGGTNIKLRKSDSPLRAKFESGRKMTPAEMVVQVFSHTANWEYDVISIGFAGPVLNGHPSEDPQNLGPGWVDFDYAKALRKPVRLINDAAMQALGSYEGGRMLFLGLGTGLGSSLILDEVVVPLELGELRYSDKRTLEEMLGKRGRRKLGQRRWERLVHELVPDLRKAFQADYVVIGGGNAKRLRRLPGGARRGSNRLAFRGGIRLWRREPMKPEVREHTVTIA